MKKDINRVRVRVIYLARISILKLLSSGRTAISTFSSINVCVWEGGWGAMDEIINYIYRQKGV